MNNFEKIMAHSNTHIQHLKHLLLEDIQLLFEISSTFPYFISLHFNIYLVTSVHVNFRGKIVHECKCNKLV